MPRRSSHRSGLAARLLWCWFVFFVFVHRNRIQIFGLKNLAAVEATDIFCTVASVQEFGPLMLASLHNEVKLILDCTIQLSSVKRAMRIRSLGPGTISASAHSAFRTFGQDSNPLASLCPGPLGANGLCWFHPIRFSSILGAPISRANWTRFRGGAGSLCSKRQARIRT
jgi:hypothetical protein